MRSLIRPLALAAIAAAAFGTTTTPANAACAGTDNTIVLCADVRPAGVPTVDPKGDSYDDCIHLVNPPCQPVSIPLPTVTPGSGYPVTASCGGRYGAALCASIGS